MAYMGKFVLVDRFTDYGNRYFGSVWTQHCRVRYDVSTSRWGRGDTSFSEKRSVPDELEDVCDSPFVGAVLISRAYWWTDRSDALLVREPWWIVPYFLYMLFLGGAVQEEYGWRGYLLDALQSRLPPLLASLSLGVVWTLWHIPLFLMVGTVQANLSFWAYGLAVMAYTILITWVYNGSSRNLWSAFLMHTMFNVMLVMVGFEAESGYPVGFIHLTITLWTAAILVIWKTYGKLSYEPLEEMIPSYPSVTQRMREGKE